MKAAVFKPNNSNKNLNRKSDSGSLPATARTEATEYPL